MKKSWYIVYIFLVTKVFSYDYNEFKADFLSLSYEKTDIQVENLKAIEDYSLAYSMWTTKEKETITNVLIRFSYGNFDSGNKVNEKYYASLAYEELYKKKLNSFINRKISLGMSYNILDFLYHDTISFENRSFKGDTQYFFKLYGYCGLEFVINDNYGIDLGVTPQLLLFKEKTARGIENNIFDNCLGIAYNFGFTYKF